MHFFFFQCTYSIVDSTICCKSAIFLFWLFDATNDDDDDGDIVDDIDIDGVSEFVFIICFQK